ncbi:MFS transporter [Pseudomonas asplenii]|uniref:MFS transporter n=1 Tax=Pseudomonas asplenii TaxID=53407 RepID=UPI00035CBFF1|nr:MFS transporter [Pseudomonas fuscovaginae]
MSARLFCFLLLVLTADGVMTFMTPVVVYMLTGSIEYSGLSYAVWWLPRLVLIPLIGRCIDTIGIKPLSILSDGIKTAGCLFLMFYDTADPLFIAVSFGVVGSLISIGNSQTLIAYEKLVATLSRAREHHVNLISRVDFLGMIVGPVVGMLLIDFGYKYLLVIPCTFYLLNAGYFSRMRWGEAGIERGKVASSIRNRPSVSSLSLIFSVPVLMGITVLAMANNMFDGLVESSGAALVELNMSLPVKYFGLIDVVAGIFGVLGTYAYGVARVKLKRPCLFLMGLFFVVVPSFFLIVFSESFAVFVSCYAMSIFGKVMCGNISRMIRIELIPAHRFASASSLMVMFNQSVLPLVGISLFFLQGGTHAVYSLMLLSVTVALASGCFVVWALGRVPDQGEADVPVR